MLETGFSPENCPAKVLMHIDNNCAIISLLHMISTVFWITQSSLQWNTLMSCSWYSLH